MYLKYRREDISRDIGGKLVVCDHGIKCLQYFFFTFFLIFIFKLYNIVLVLPNIEMNPPQVYMCLINYFSFW